MPPLAQSLSSPTRTVSSQSSETLAGYFSRSLTTTWVHIFFPLTLGSATYYAVLKSRWDLWKGHWLASWAFSASQAYSMVFPCTSMTSNDVEKQHDPLKTQPACKSTAAAS